MKIAVLTAACQYTPKAPRERFKSEPLEASRDALLDWVVGANLCGLDGIQIAAAIQEVDSYIPPEQMLDPVASHLPIRTLKDGSGHDLTDDDAAQIADNCNEMDLTVTDLGMFENLLNPDNAVRHQIHEHIRRGRRAAKKLANVGCKGVATFIGRDTSKSIDENLILFRKQVVPLLKKFQDDGLVLRIENCPMPGWSPAETFIHNIGTTPGLWIALCDIAQQEGVDDALRITYDESHSILSHSRAKWVFDALFHAGLHHLIDSAHAKDQNQVMEKIALHNSYGQRHNLGIRDNEGQIVTDPKSLGGAWGRMNSFHTLPGFTKYNSYAQLSGRQADWFEHQYGLREKIQVDPEKTYIILEHEMGSLRDQDFERVLEAIKLSAQFIRGIDAAADAQFRISQWIKEVTGYEHVLTAAVDPLELNSDRLYDEVDKL